MALAAQGCQSEIACVPDGTPACECTLGDSHECTDDAGLPGLQACSMTGRWTACAAYSDASTPRDAQYHDAPGFDLGPRD